MKYYETNFEEYVQSTQRYNIHPELENILEESQSLRNLILYGPSGVGKYSQALKIINQYSKSNLKYDKKISMNTDKPDKKPKTKKEDSKTKKSNTIASKKNDYVYRISDIHYEIDMATLGCNSKSVWFEIFFQIIDIISLKPNKTGIIVCKNFHMIYNELLEVFNSYVRHPSYNINVYFILLTEHLSFIPDSILKSFTTIPVRRPNKNEYIQVIAHQNKNIFGNSCPIQLGKNERDLLHENLNCAVPSDSIMNVKEMNILKRTRDFPTDVFNIVTDTILQKILNPSTINIQQFRNDIYELLIYNTDIAEVLFYILNYLIQNKILDAQKTNAILIRSFTFLKYYNNNYRPIYHLENIIFYIICIIHFKKD
jgi:DNA polymerase III delta prime subunit